MVETGREGEQGAVVHPGGAPSQGQYLQNCMCVSTDLSRESGPREHKLHDGTAVGGALGAKVHVWVMTSVASVGETKGRRQRWALCPPTVAYWTEAFSLASGVGAGHC